jgi:acyl carrier protein
VSGWTSLAHLELILMLERTFDVTFEADEIAQLASVAAIVGALEKRRPA